ncbi:MAG: hypothetical protein QXK26_04005 [Candidatus Bathyarchaeia archaeon]
MAPAWDLMSAVILFFGVIAFIIVMLLPAIMELKKPRDAGPKILEGDEQNGINLLHDMETSVKIDWAIIRQVAEIIAILPSLEP